MADLLDPKFVKAEISRLEVAIDGQRALIRTAAKAVMVARYRKDTGSLPGLLGEERRAKSHCRAMTTELSLLRDIATGK